MSWFILRLCGAELTVSALEQRAWMLQPEWLINSVKKGEMLAEAEYDYERIRDTARENNKKAVDLGEVSCSALPPGTDR